jgi:AcrR family transcriptional regulator
MNESLRQHKKALQRQQILFGALRLFGQKGYDETTIADIAQAAGCAQRTFFLYFRSKEEILPALLQRSIDELAALLQQRAKGQSTLDCFEQWMLQQLSRHVGPQDFRPHSSLVAKQKQHLSTMLEPVLTASFAADLGMEPQAHQAKLAATAATLSLSAFELEHTTHDQRVQYVQQAITFLRAGMQALDSIKI